MSGWIQPEKHVLDAIRSTLDLIKASFADDTINQLLSNIFGDLSSKQKKMIKEWFRRNDINLIYGYPIDHEKLPCMAIVIDPEEQVQQYIGDQYVNLDQETELTGERWRSQMCVLCYAENMDLVRWMYHLAKYSLSTSRIRLSRLFQYAQDSAGKDLVPERFGEGGRVRYGRSLAFSVEYDQKAYRNYMDAPDWDDNSTSDDDSPIAIEPPDDLEEIHEIDDYTKFPGVC